MFKVVAGISPILLAATMVAGAAGQQQSTTPESGRGRTAAPVTVTGCVVRNGSVDPDKGTRVLDIAPGALALTSARIVARTGASSGAAPQENNTGTIPQKTIVGGRSGETSTLSFALTGDRLSGLGDFVGRRVEVVGRLAQSADTAQPRGTTGASRDAAPVPGVGTREERPAEGTAHPSAELGTLEVESFRGTTGGCE